MTRYLFALDKKTKTSSYRPLRFDVQQGSTVRSVKS